MSIAGYLEQYEVNTFTPPTQAHGAWLYAACDDWWYPEDTERSGKWLIFLSNETVDRYWRLIQLALAMWRLGTEAKVTTGMKKPGKHHVICVYTYDYTDKADVMRIRQELYDIGIRRPIKYKADEQTRQGLYGANWPEDLRNGPFVPVYCV